MTKCELVQAKDGNWLPLVTKDREVYYFGSTYDGNYAADRWIEHYIDSKMENIIFFGLGDGQIVYRLLRRLPGTVLVYEPDESLYRELKKTALFGKIEKEKKFHIVCGEDSFLALRDEITDILNEDCVETTALLAHPGYVRHYEEQYRVLREASRVVCDAVATLQSTMARFVASMIDNQIRNFPYTRNGIPVARLAKYWQVDAPVIIIGAGPSLLKNVEMLKKAKNHAFLFCCDSALPVVMDHGIVPDLVGSSDADKSMDFFSRPGSYDIPYCLVSVTRHELVRKLTGHKLWGHDNTMYENLMSHQGIELSKSGGKNGVATFLFALAIELGLHRIILVGQDLAYSEKKQSHSHERQEEYVEEYIEEVPGYYGGVVSSRYDWNVFRTWYEEVVQNLPPEYEIINATEGGARIRGTTQKSLLEVVEQLPKEDVDFSELLEDHRVHITEQEYERMMREYSRLPAQVQKIKKQGYHRTFFEEDMTGNLALPLIVTYMKCLREIPDRKERFERAVSYIGDRIQEAKIDDR